MAMSDARERRRARAESDKGGFDAASWLKENKVYVIIGLVWLAFVGYNGAVIAGAIEAGGEDCPGHWHARLQVYADGQKINMGGYPQFNALGNGDAAGFHVHNQQGSDPEILHFHPAGNPRCIPLEDALAHLSVDVGADQLVLSSPYPAAGTYMADENNTLQVWYKPFEGDWRQVTKLGSFMDGQMGNGDRVLIYHGSPDGLEAARAASGGLGDSYEPSGDEPTDPKYMINIIATSILALVAVLVVRGLKNSGS